MNVAKLPATRRRFFWIRSVHVTPAISARHREFWDRHQQAIIARLSLSKSEVHLIGLGGEATEVALRCIAIIKRHFCSDMWKAYLNVIRKRAAHCLHVLDRFHIVAHLSKAIDKVRASEARDLRKRGSDELLKHSRWAILRRPENRTEKDDLKLVDIVRANLRTARSVLLREELYVLWTYHSRAWAGKFLDSWCRKVMRSRIEPLKKFARMLRNHRELILNWFHAKALSSGIVEGFNGKAKRICLPVLRHA